MGPLIAAGPIMATLAGVGVGGAIGGVAGALVGMGIPEYEAKRYEGRIQKGGILLSVNCASSDEVTRAKEIMHRTGAADVSSTGKASADVPATERTMRRRAGGVEQPKAKRRKRRKRKRKLPLFLRETRRANSLIPRRAL
jgi:hypothetical protein